MGNFLASDSFVTHSTIAPFLDKLMAIDLFGAGIVKNRWMEQPPQVIKREVFPLIFTHTIETKL